MDEIIADEKGMIKKIRKVKPKLKVDSEGLVDESEVIEPIELSELEELKLDLKKEIANINTKLNNLHKSDEEHRHKINEIKRTKLNTLIGAIKRTSGSLAESRENNKNKINELHEYIFKKRDEVIHKNGVHGAEASHLAKLQDCLGKFILSDDMLWKAIVDLDNAVREIQDSDKLVYDE